MGGERRVTTILASAVVVVRSMKTVKWRPSKTIDWRKIGFRGWHSALSQRVGQHGYWDKIHSDQYLPSQHLACHPFSPLLPFFPASFLPPLPSFFPTRTQDQFSGNSGTVSRNVQPQVKWGFSNTQATQSYSVMMCDRVKSERQNGFSKTRSIIC